MIQWNQIAFYKSSPCFGYLFVLLNSNFSKPVFQGQNFALVVTLRQDSLSYRMMKFGKCRFLNSLGCFQSVFFPPFISLDLCDFVTLFLKVKPTTNCVSMNISMTPYSRDFNQVINWCLKILPTHWMINLIALFHDNQILKNKSSV
jgi:hypothetical protein